jgi:hypothetical protein
MLVNAARARYNAVKCTRLSCSNSNGWKSGHSWLKFLPTSLAAFAPRLSGFSLEGNWLCSEDCLRWAVGQGILELWAQPATGRAFRQTGPRIGTFLRAKGWITSEQLNQALEHQREEGGKLGQCLLELGFISEKDILNGLSEQLKIPCILHPISTVGETAVLSLPKMLSTKFKVVPLEYQPGVLLSLAMDVDLDEQVIQAVREVLGFSIQPYLVPREILQRLIERFYLPLPDENPDAVDTSQNAAEQIGKLFIERWSQHNIRRARIAVFNNLAWVRYMSRARTFDHLLSAAPPEPEI